MRGNEICRKFSCHFFLKLALIKSLLGFNLGVEAGQLAIVILVFPIAALLRDTTFYRTWIFSGGSTVAAMIATVWIFERLFDYEVLGF